MEAKSRSGNRITITSTQDEQRERKQGKARKRHCAGGEWALQQGDQRHLDRIFRGIVRGRGWRRRWVSTPWLPQLAELEAGLLPRESSRGRIAGRAGRP
jgi:hypothetical protein